MRPVGPREADYQNQSGDNEGEVGFAIVKMNRQWRINVIGETKNMTRYFSDMVVEKSSNHHLS